MPIRVLVVDDSVVVRRVVARAIEADDGLELAGVAADGRRALEKIDSTRPDVLVLDLEMPVMDGFEVLRRLRHRGAGIPIVVFSHASASRAAAALEALSLGATDFVLKPTAASGLGLGESYVTNELLPLLRSIGERRPVPAAPPPAPIRRRPTAPVELDAIVIAVSTGGPNALADIVGGLPSGLTVPLLVVQHMPPIFTGQLAKRLDRIGTVPVHEAPDNELVRPGHVYLAPGGRHMAVERSGRREVRIVLGDGPPENSCRPAGDVLFRSAAAVYGESLLGLVMTGMGRDGLRGAEAINAAGGWVIVQDPTTAVVDGMPRAVASAGLAAEIVPLPQIASALVRWTARVGA